MKHQNAWKVKNAIALQSPKCITMSTKLADTSADSKYKQDYIMQPQTANIQQMQPQSVP